MKQYRFLGKHNKWNMTGSVPIALIALLLVSCSDSRSTPTNVKQENSDPASPLASEDDLDTLGSVEGPPVTDESTGADDPQQGVSDPDSQAGRVGLVVDSAQRCAKIFEPLQVVITRQLLDGEEPLESGGLPNVTGLTKFDQSYGASLNLVSRTDESANFEMSTQDIVGLTSSIENGSVTIFIAGYEPESPQRFIMRKPVPNGCMYAFKSDDYCSTGLAKAGSIAFSRNGVSMTAIGCELDNPDDLPVLEVPATGG